MKHLLPNQLSFRRRLPASTARRAFLVLALIPCMVVLAACQARPTPSTETAAPTDSAVNDQDKNNQTATNSAIGVATLPPATFTLKKVNDASAVTTSYSLQFDGSAAATPLSALAVRVTFPSDQTGQTVQMTEQPFQVNPQLTQNGWLVAVNTITQNPADGSQSAELALINTKPDGLLLVEPTELATLAVVAENPNQTAEFDQQTTQVVTKDAQLLQLQFLTQ